MNEHVVLVTGALTGIGRATATAFGRDGASVVVSGRHDEEGEALAAELRTLGGKAEYLRADVSIEDDVRSLIDATIETFGELDAAVNNAAPTPTSSAGWSPRPPRPTTPHSTPTSAACCSA
jgi:NAD(P)-dependent dehydrogenase (short-subunit alcohol dehydrogenase family)